MLRIIRGVLTAVLVLAVVAVAVAWLLLRASLPRYDGDIVLAGLGAPVIVERDAQGVPTLRARDRLDLARALGYVHAQERYFQMDLQRRAAAGELAELFGARALDLDRERRVHRMRALAARVLGEAPAEDQALLHAYAAGVNAGLRGLWAQPFEYFLLMVEPQPWVPEDSLLVAYSMWFQLTDELGRREGRLALMSRVLPAQLVDFLVPSGTEWDAPLQGEAVVPPPPPGAELYDLRRLQDVDFDAVAWGDPLPRLGSNSWAVSGAHTDDGRALVANDMHLGYALPHVWYRARLRMDGPAPLDITGVTLPGMPTVVVGSNGYVAWAFTNSYGDWTDLVTLELDPENPLRYRTVDGWQHLERVQETINVKGANPEVLEIRRSIWGPLVEGPGGEPYALRWLAHEVQATNLSLVLMEQAHNVEEAVAVAIVSGQPPQNIIIGDRDGNIAWTIAGRIPVREGYDPLRPASWADGAGWQGWLPPQDYPRIVNPESGRLWSGNARKVDGEWLELIGDGGYAGGARQRQIRDALLAQDRFEPGDMLRLQLDDRALLLEPWHALLLELLDEEAQAGSLLRTEARDWLDIWGARAATDSVGYHIVRRWRQAVYRRAVTALTAEVRAADPAFRFEQFWQWEAPVWMLVTQRPPHLLHPHFDTWEAFLLDTLDQVLDEMTSQSGGLRAQTWGERNRLHMRHPLSGALPWLSRYLDMPQVPLPGDVNVPRVHTQGFGASQRMGVAPGRENAAYFHMPGGQSGHPLSPYYHAGHEDWVHGRPAPLLPGKPKHELRLVPG